MPKQTRQELSTKLHALAAGGDETAKGTLEWIADLLADNAWLTSLLKAAHTGPPQKNPSGIDGVFDAIGDLLKPDPRLDADLRRRANLDPVDPRATPPEARLTRPDADPWAAGRGEVPPPVDAIRSLVADIAAKDPVTFKQPVEKPEFKKAAEEKIAHLPEVASDATPPRPPEPKQ